MPARGTAAAGALINEVQSLHGNPLLMVRDTNDAGPRRHMLVKPALEDKRQQT